MSSKRYPGIQGCLALFLEHDAVEISCHSIVTLAMMFDFFLEPAIRMAVPI